MTTNRRHTTTPQPPAAATKAHSPTTPTNPTSPGEERPARRITAAYLERRGDILRAAGEIFYDKGYHAASMQEIADRAGILKAALYYYIRSKEDLLFELAAGEQVEAFIQEFADGDKPVRALDGVARLKAFVVRWIKSAESGQPKASLAIEREYRHLSPVRQQRALALGQELPGLLETIIRQGVDDGSFDPAINVPLASRNVWAILKDLYNSYTSTGPFTIDELMDWHIGFIFRALGVPDPLW